MSHPFRETLGHAGEHLEAERRNRQAERQVGMDKVTIRVRVRLEPELEKVAGDLDWQARLRLAAVYAEKSRRYAQWARELRVTGRALRPAPPGPRRLRPLSSAGVVRN